MLKKKYAVMFLSLALTVSGLAGCAGSSTDRTEAKEKTESVVFESMVYGEVSAVRDNTLTIKLGTVEASEESQEETGEAGEASESAEEMSSVSEGGSSEEAQSKELPEEGRMRVSLTLTGQEVTIQLKNETVIESLSFDERDGEVSGADSGGITSKAIALSDISEGDIVSVAFDEDVYAQTITVLSSD
ncbi:MAG: hypothetical protein LUH58_01505 [Lachnospiraceae bacterium]|nr:hypothetical protein [Lachnospiraceae bacterium]